MPFISPSSFSALTAPCPRPSCSVGLGAGARPQAHLRQRRRPAHRERRRAQQRPAAQRVRSIMPTTTSITTTSIPMTLRLLQRRLPRLRRPRQCRKTCVGESGAGNLRRRRRRRLRPRPRRLLHHPLSHLPPLRLAPCPFSSRGLQSVACASLTLRTPMGRRRASSRPAYPARLGDSGATRVCNRARGPSSGPTSDVAASSSARMGNLCDVEDPGLAGAPTARAAHRHPSLLRVRHVLLPCRRRPRPRPRPRRPRHRPRRRARRGQAAAA